MSEGTGMDAAGHRVIERLSRERLEDAPPLLTGVTVTVGQRARIQGGGLNPSPTLNPQANVATIEFKLLGAQHRQISTVAFVQAWREEVGVLPYVRLPADERNSITDVEGYLLRTPSGAEVPVTRVASMNSGLSPPAIPRKDGRRVVTVTADVDPAVISGKEANNILANSILSDLTAVYPDLAYTFGGEQQQQLESLDALYRGFAIAILMIFTLLAIPLRSYTKPFIIMAVIPFGFIGVILGHWVLGIALSAVSFMGVFGLSGGVVNDSLLMIVPALYAIRLHPVSLRGNAN